MIFELMIVGSWMFWTVAIALFCLEFYYVGEENPWVSILILVMGLVLYFGFTNFNAVAYWKESWQSVLWTIAIYFGVAPIWATWKWFIFTSKRGKIYAKALESWVKEEIQEGIKIKSINDIPLSKRLSFLKFLQKQYITNKTYTSYEEWHVDWDIRGYQDEQSRILKIQNECLLCALSSPAKNKEKITVWMVSWPFSILTTLVFDFLVDFMNWIRESFHGVFVKISKIAFGKYRSDFDSIEVEKE